MMFCSVKKIAIFSCSTLLLAMWLTPIYGQQGVQVAAGVKVNRASSQFTPIKAKVRSGKRIKEVTVVARQGEKIIFTESDTGIGVKLALSISKIDDITFEMKYDAGDIYRHLKNKDWNKAVRYLSPIVNPTLPYLDVANNNAVELSLDLGTYMLKGAKKGRLTAQTDADNELVKKQYVSAYGVFKSVAKATWSPLADEAELRRIECLLELNKPKTAARDHGKIQEPDVSDPTYGRYWLLAARIGLEKSKFREAMSASIKSICFQNKDIDTFPDALLVSAQCYEEMQNWFRARDIYYEVAMIFPKTEWAVIAERRLKFILKNGFTKKEEKSPIQNVFFGLDEDVNKLIVEMFKKRREAKAKAKPVAKKAKAKEIDLNEEE